MLEKEARRNFIVLATIILGLFILFAGKNYSDFNSVTGYIIKNTISNKTNFNQEYIVGDLFYDTNYDNFYVIFSIKDDKNYVAKYYPKIHKWEETSMYVQDNFMYMDNNKDMKLPLMKIDKNFLPKDSLSSGYIRVINNERKEYNLII